MIYVTHDQEEALSMADRIVIMNEGEIKQIGSPREIYKNPGSRFVAEFVGTSNFIVGKRKGKSVRFGDREIQVAGCDAIIGETVHLAIRPEKIQCITSKQPPPSCPISNIMEITAEVITFLGAVVQITFTLEGIEMNVDLTEGEFIRTGIKRGDKIKLYFPKDAFHVFSADPSHR
jgi:ABC-type Fe3+/spermidine/putrescine transport system ATPase subunit